MTGIELIEVERLRQVTEEGRTPEHDKQHDEGELAMAAAAFLRVVQLRRAGHSASGGRFIALSEGYWPWDTVAFKPADDVRDLTRAGALIAAELDRIGTP